MTPLSSELSEQHKAHGPNWTKWLGHLSGMPDRTGLELGCWRGESAEWMLDHIFTGHKSGYVTVDTFEGSEEHHMGGIDCTANEKIARERLARFGDAAIIIKGTSFDHLRTHAFHCQTNPGKYLFDFVYVDAAHDAMNVLRDSVLAFDMLKPGGIMVWDDYEWTVMQQPVDRPKLAIDAFLTCYARQVEVIGMGWQVAVKKL